MAKPKEPVILPVTPLPGGTFEVPSETKPGTTYLVERWEDQYHCNCQAGVQGKFCKHVRSVMHYADTAERNHAEAIDLEVTSQPRKESKVADPKPAPESKAPSTTKRGYLFGEVASAVQKEIRHGDEVAAVYWTLELYNTSPYYAWKRVLVIAAEDVGFGSPEAVALVGNLNQQWLAAKQNSYYVSPHHITMAVMALCRAPKSTEVEDLQSWLMEAVKAGMKRPMPWYAKDAHTAAGKARQATWDEWYAIRHQLFGIPVNPYTEKLWEMHPEWAPNPHSLDADPGNDDSEYVAMSTPEERAAGLAALKELAARARTPQTAPLFPDPSLAWGPPEEPEA